MKNGPDKDGAVPVVFCFPIYFLLSPSCLRSLWSWDTLGNLLTRPDRAGRLPLCPFCLTRVVHTNVPLPRCTPATVSILLPVGWTRKEPSLSFHMGLVRQWEHVSEDNRSTERLLEHVGQEEEGLSCQSLLGVACSFSLWESALAAKWWKPSLLSTSCDSQRLNGGKLVFSWAIDWWN